MPQETITIDDAASAAGGLTNVVYELYRDTPDQKVYTESGKHTLTHQSILTLSRTPHKKSGNYLGTSRGSIKLTREVDVLGDNGDPVKVPIVFELRSSIPVGTAAQDVLDIQNVFALLFSDNLATGAASGVVEQLHSYLRLGE